MILSQEHKKKRYFFLSRRIVVCFLISITLNSTHAQVQRGKKDDAKAELISFKDRWGIKTNAVDWLLTVPNIGVEFDLGNTIRNKQTIGANIKWNWNTSQKYTPSLIFNVFDARVEWRQYFRTRKRGGITKDANLMTRLKETVFTTQRKNPRQERAYYWGVYVNAASYNFKIGKEGRQGNAYGAGISVGYTAPLYGYRNNYIDLELGGSAGLLYTSYDVYTHDAESGCYPRIAEKCKGGHIVPFPLITDLRVAFVYRFMSAGSKYKESVYRRVQLRDFARQALNEKINKMRERIDSINNAIRKQGFSRPDSLLDKEELKQWKLMQQERKELAAKEGSQVMPVSARIEEEISQLDGDEKAMFLEELNMSESGLDRLIKASYTLLGLISYLTAGEPEVRAWTITKGTKAPQAAGKIHTDFERGFIRAEVVHYDDLMECGSMTAAKEKGLVRSEGKDYVMKDGDIVLFRFNV